MTRNAQPKVPISTAGIVHVDITTGFENASIQEHGRRAEWISSEEEMKRLGRLQIRNLSGGGLEHYFFRELTGQIKWFMTREDGRQVRKLFRQLDLLFQFVRQPKIVLVKQSDPIICTLLDRKDPRGAAFGAIIFVVDVFDAGPE